MIAYSNEAPDTDSTWQSEFLAMLPEIEARLRCAFRWLDPESRAESVQEAVAHSLFAYARLHEQGRAHVATAATLTFYSAREVKSGRPAAGRMNRQEPLSRYGQLGSGIKVEQPPTDWIDTMVADQRASVVDLVAAKLDFRDWFKTLSRRMRQIAKDLAFGNSTSEVAKKHGLTAGRISQLRRKLAVSWADFQQEAVPALSL